jgi:hypothetical protein
VQAVTGSSDEATAVRTVLQELCLQLAKASLPSGGESGQVLPFSCESG